MAIVRQYGQKWNTWNLKIPKDAKTPVKTHQICFMQKSGWKERSNFQKNVKILKSSKTQWPFFKAK